MHRKRSVLIPAYLLAAILLTGRSTEAASLIIATDLHYIAPQLTDNGTYFQEINDRGDGKIMLYSEVLTDAFIQQVIDRHPDALILSGDLTFNGAVLSHEELAKRLRRIFQEGIPVLVIPGNHDLDNPNAAKFEGYSFEKTDSESAEGFRSLYYDLGPDQSDSAAPDSLSYLYSITDKLKVLMLDTNSVSQNHISGQTMKWIREVLKKSSGEGAEVIAVSHQNLYQHSPLFQTQFRINEADELAQVYEKYHVIVNLSGHMHIQHMVSGDGKPFCAEMPAGDGVPEIATSSLAVNPLQYGVIQVADGQFHYENESVDAVTYLKEHESEFAALDPDANLTDPNLRNLGSYALQYFRKKPMEEVKSEYASPVESQADLETMAECFADLNTAYFAGDKIDISSMKDGLDLWSSVPTDLTTQYIDSIVQDAESHSGDYHQLTICGNSVKSSEN